MDFDSAWEMLSEPWRRCFQLGWQAHRAGSAGVGAVMVDPAGTVIATGRNRRAEGDAPTGQLAGTHLAHAEVNALLGLHPGRYEQHVLYTTLEPCLLCTAALIHCHVGEVRYAATDPLWRGVERLSELNEQIARRFPVRIGPLSGPFSVWATVLPLIWTLDRAATSVIIAAHELHAPAVLGLARRLSRTKPSVLGQDSLAEAMRALWPSLVRIEGGRA